MDIVLLVVRIVLAGVFIVAGITKLADRSGTRAAAIDFGVPARFAPLVALLLPLAEIAIAVALIPTTTAWPASLAALSLLALFSAGVGVSLARGENPDCHCFGQLHSEPVGWITLVRNGVLIALAALVLVFGMDDPGPSAVAWLGNLAVGQAITLIAGAALFGLVIVQGWFLLRLSQQNGRILERLERLEAGLQPGVAAAPAAARGPTAGLPVGTPAPAFSLSSVDGETVTLVGLLAPGKLLLLLFSDPNCTSCNALLPQVEIWQRQHQNTHTWVSVNSGTLKDNRAKAALHGITTTLLQPDRKVSDAYQVRGTPSLVLVNRDGTIGSPMATGSEAIRDLVARTAGTRPDIPMPPTPAPQPNGGPSPAATTTPRRGAPAPPIGLSNLDGEPIELASYQGSDTLLLFWNPRCDFCRKMLPDLKAWEADPPEGAPRLLVISRGTVATNRAQGLNSTIVLDQSLAASQAYGVGGTPTAILIDAQGNIASDPAAGIPAVLSLAGYQSAQPAQ